MFLPFRSILSYSWDRYGNTQNSIEEDVKITMCGDKIEEKNIH